MYQDHARIGPIYLSCISHRDPDFLVLKNIAIMASYWNVGITIKCFANCKFLSMTYLFGEVIIGYKGTVHVKQ